MTGPMGTQRSLRGSPRKLVLAYPPYSTATAPPLGVFTLKAYVERVLPDWSVKVLDLNLEAHHELFRGLRRGDGLPEGGRSSSASSERDLLRAAEVFRGQHPDEFFDDPDRMIAHSFLWRRAVPRAVATPAALRNAVLGKGPLPPWVRRQAELILVEKPSVVGLSLCYPEQLRPALSLARVLHQRASVPVVFGGTLFNAGVNGSWSAERWPVAYFVVGSGERPLTAILRGEADRGPVPGVVRRQGGRLVACPPSFENDLDAIDGPDFSDADVHGYYSPVPVLPVLTSRGCYWRRCAFCTHYRAAGDTYQLRSIANVVAELGRHAAAGIRHFALMDDIISPARLSQLSRAIVDARLGIQYYGMAKPVKQFDRETLEQVARSGCRFLLWGVESGCQRVLDLMDKGIAVDVVEQVLDTAAEVGIKNHVFVICGFPTETREEFRATVELLGRHRASVAHVHKSTFVLEQNTPIFEEPAKYSITRHWPLEGSSLFGYECSTGMTREEALETFDQALPELRSFDSPITELPDFRSRDHLLLLYGHGE
jgi:hypothetical protein